LAVDALASGFEPGASIAIHVRQMPRRGESARLTGHPAISPNSPSCAAALVRGYTGVRPEDEGGWPCHVARHLSRSQRVLATARRARERVSSESEVKARGTPSGRARSAPDAGLTGRGNKETAVAAETSPHDSGSRPLFRNDRF